MNKDSLILKLQILDYRNFLWKSSAPQIFYIFFFELSVLLFAPLGCIDDINTFLHMKGCMNNLTFGDEDFGYYETIAGGAGAVSDMA